MFGGVADAENYDSLVSFKNCFFEANSAFLFTVSAGGGCAIMAKGGGTSKVLTENCYFFNSGITLRGYLFLFYLNSFVL